MLGGLGSTVDPLCPSVCLSVNLHQHPTPHWSQFAGRKRGRATRGGRAGGSEASREGLQTTDKLYTLP